MVLLLSKEDKRPTKGVKLKSAPKGAATLSLFVFSWVSAGGSRRVILPAARLQSAVCPQRAGRATAAEPGPGWSRTPSPAAEPRRAARCPGAWRRTRRLKNTSSHLHWQEAGEKPVRSKQTPKKCISVCSDLFLSVRFPEKIKGRVLKKKMCFYI